VEKAPHLKGLVRNIYDYSHYGLEPLTDIGYPTKTQVESGCAIGFVPKEGSIPRAKEIWLSCLISKDDDKTYVAFALSKRTLETFRKRPLSDISKGSEKLFVGKLDDPTFLKDVFDYALSSTTSFLNYVISEYEE